MLFVSRSTVWARRSALLAGFALALALVWLLASGWMRERRAAEATRLTNDGIGLLGLDREEEAQKAFRSALGIDPDNATALGNLAIVETRLGDHESALAHAQAAVRAAPGEAVYRYNLGNLLALERRDEEAIASLRQAIEIDPKYTNAYNELGNVYLALDRSAEARKAFETGLSRDPTLAKLHKNLARTALAEGHPEEAILHLETALPLYSPADPAGKAEAAYWLATAQAMAGHATEACAALQQLKILDPLLLAPFARDAGLLARRHRCSPWP